MTSKFRIARPGAIATVLALLWQSAVAIADKSSLAEVPLSVLRELDLSYQSVTALAETPGAALKAVSRNRAGDAFAMALPMAAQQVEFLLPPGSAVTPGTPVVRLSGPEVGLWLLETDSVATRYQTARQRHERNLPLLAAGAISESRWEEIQRQYHTLWLENAHRQHLLELAVPDASNDHGEGAAALTLSAPVAGTIEFKSHTLNGVVSEPLFEIIPKNAARLMVEVPWRQADTITSLRYADCQVAISQVEQSATGFFITAWSDSLSDSCRRPPGVVISVQPIYRRQTLLVPPTAVFQWHQSPHVLVKNPDSLTAIPVQIITDVNGNYAIAAADHLTGQQVLVSSVSAVQGVLIGLGKD